MANARRPASVDEAARAFAAAHRAAEANLRVRPSMHCWSYQQQADCAACAATREDVDQWYSDQRSLSRARRRALLALLRLTKGDAP